MWFEEKLPGSLRMRLPLHHFIDYATWVTTNIQGIFSLEYQTYGFISIFLISKHMRRHHLDKTQSTCVDGRVHGAGMGSIWGRQDPCGPHVGPMNFAIWIIIQISEMVVDVLATNRHQDTNCHTNDVNSISIQFKKFYCFTKYKWILDTHSSTQLQTW